MSDKTSDDKKKAPDHVEDERRLTRQVKSNTSDIQSQEKSLKNKQYPALNALAELPDYMELYEVDPERPDNYKDISGRYWCFILYPESAPKNWREILNLSGMEWAISPLHDKDLNADGSVKKPHYHVIIVWMNKTTYNNVSEFTHVTLNSTYPQKLGSPVGYYRYFTHADNPEKAPYSKKDIVSGNGFDIAEYQKMTREQKLEMHMMLTQEIIDRGIDNYVDAIMLGASMGFDEYDMITSHTLHFTNLCKSIGYKKRS